MFFIEGTEEVVRNSLQRANVMSENERFTYATKLIDFYRGFAKKHIEDLVDKTITTQSIKTNMKNLIIPMPILQNFVDEISAVYRSQPQRTFTLNGKRIVKEIDETLKADRFVKDPVLFEKLEKLYSRKLKLTIKKAEQLTNLLSTTIFKLNFRDDVYFMDFLPNDAAVVLEDKVDSTRMERIKFVKYFDRSILAPVYEDWTTEKFTTTQGKKETTAIDNRAVAENEKLYKRKHNDSGFAPFVVFRNDLATDDFWNVRDKDILDVVEQILVAFTELRYLQRFGAFGLKYVVGGKLPENGALDITGILEILPPVGSQVPGQQSSVQVGEFSNTARIKELSDSIFDLLKFLYDLYGISIDRLVTSGQATTAESKHVDRQTLQEYIETQQEIWRVNEENLFATLTAVYNRDHESAKLPAGLEIQVDFEDPQSSAVDMAAKIEANMAKVQNNLMSVIDWIREDNPDLSEEEAKTVYLKNKSLNDELISSLASPIPDAVPPDGDNPPDAGAPNPLIENADDGTPPVNG